MSPARQHRERHAALAATSTEATDRIASASEGGQQEQPTPLPVAGSMSPARAHRERVAAETGAVMAAEAANDETDKAEELAQLDPATAMILTRLTADLRTLKAIQSTERKVEAKRTMLPEYAAFVDGRLAADDHPVADEILPTLMVWSIDVGEYERALQIAEHVLRHKLPMPARYNRTAGTVVLEEIAEAAIKALKLGEPFDLAVLDLTNELTASADRPDEAGAKLHKAIGLELVRQAEALAAADGQIDATMLDGTRHRALEQLIRAQTLHDRIGVKTNIDKLKKALAPPAAAPAANDNTGG